MRETTRVCARQKKLLLQVAGMAGSIDVAEVTQRLAQLPGAWENFDVAVIAFSDILDAAKETGNSIRRKEQTDKMAEANKAFAHFRY